MKKIASFLAFLLMCLILLLGITPLFFVGRASQLVEDQCNKNLQAKVSFSDLSLSLLRHFPQLTVTLSDLEVAGIDTFSQDTLVRAEKIRLVVNLASLLSEEGVDIKQIDLIRPRVKCLVLGDGRANWNITIPDSVVREKSDTSTIRIALRKISVQEARVVYDDRQSGINVVIDQWTGSLKGDLSSKQSRLETTSIIEALSFGYGGSTYLEQLRLEADVALEADFEQSRYTLSSNQIVLNDMPVSLKGFVQLPDTSTIRMDVSLNTEKVTVKNLLSLVPALYKKEFESLQANGILHLSAYARGDWTDQSYPAFEVKLGVKDGSFKYPKLPGAVTNMMIDAQLSHDSGSLDKTLFDVDRFQLTLAGQPIVANLHVSTPISDPAVDASLRGTVDLGLVKSFYPMDESQTLSGIVKADVHLAARLSSVEKKKYDQIRASGGAVATGVQFKQKGGTPVRIEKASLGLTPSAIRLETFNLKMGKNDVLSSGLLENYLQWFMNKGILSGRLDVRSNNLNVNELMAEKEVYAAKGTPSPKMEKPDTATLTAFEVPEKMDLSLNLQVSALRFNELILKDLKGALRVGSGRIRLDDVKANTMGGTLGVSGYYETLVPEQPLADLGVQLKQVSYKETFKTLALIRKLAPVFEKVQGIYSMELNIHTPLDKHLNPVYGKLTGRGRLTSDNLKLTGVKVLDLLAATLKNPSLSTLSPKNIDVSFMVKEGRIKTAPFNVNIQQTRLLFEGSSGIDKTLDYKVTATLPQTVGLQGLSSVKGTITGTFDNPKINMDLAGLAKQAAKGVAEKLVKELTGGTIDQQVAKAREAVEKQAALLRAQAKAAGDKLMAEAAQEGNKLIEKATNPVLKMAAKAAADRLMAQAKEQAVRLEAKAEEKIKELYKEQGLN